MTSELPAVSSIASRPPSDSSHLAVVSDSSVLMPPRTPSAMFSLAVTAMGVPSFSTARRTAITMPRATFARFCSDPPNSSLRRLISGDRNELAK